MTRGEVGVVLERHGVPWPEHPLEPCVWPMAEALLRLEQALAAARQQGRAEVAALLEQGAARVAPAGKRTNQVDQHTAEVLRDYARQAREGGEG